MLRLASEARMRQNFTDGYSEASESRQRLRALHAATPYTQQVSTANSAK